MEQFDIIGKLKEYAEAKGWKFDMAIDDRNQDFNRSATQDLDAGDNILLVAVRMTPTFSGATVAERNFSTLLMLGRKFDEAGTESSLDEYSIEKYNNRLFSLQGELENFIGGFACDNELDLTPSTFSYAKNLFDEVIDFVMCSNVQFIQ